MLACAAGRADRAILTLDQNMPQDQPHPTAADIVAPRRDETIPGLLRGAAQRFPEKPFVIFPDHSGYQMTYAAALMGAENLARSLREGGIGMGARIAVYLPNGPAYVWTWMATLLGGYVDVTINPSLRGAALAYALNKARVDAVITDPAGLAGLASVPELTRTPPVFVVPSDGGIHATRATRLAWGDWACQKRAAPAGLNDEPFPATDPLGLASIRFTSGSTGFPKGVMMSQAHMLASAKMFCHMTSFGSDDAQYSCFPVHHVFASVTGILSSLCAQGTLVLARRFSASKYWDHIREHGVTIAHVLDAQVAILHSAPPSDLDRAHKVRVMYTASASYPQFEARFGVEILPLFDMSELTVVAHYPPGVPRREGSCGLSSSLFDIGIVDDQDYPLSPGEEGQIVVRPRVPHVMMLGYFDDAELTVERWSNLWFHTGDRGVLDGDGYLYFKGRLGDRIRVRGVNVSASELEAVAARHPAIAEVAVIGVPASLGEDDIKICASLKENTAITPRALLDHMATELPAYLVPRYVDLRQNFPRTDTEKIRKAALRDEGERGLTEATWDAKTGEFYRKAAADLDSD
jgi:carnitine-CoA ligase